MLGQLTCEEAFVGSAGGRRGGPPATDDATLSTEHEAERITPPGPEQRKLAAACTFFVLRRIACKNATSFEWAMLGSNQRPLPCEGSATVCWSFLELAKLLQIAVLPRQRFS